MKVSDLFLRCLEAEGVEYIFGIPGEENGDVMISLLDSQRHELANVVSPPPDVSPDARLVYTFPEAGMYYVRINDRIFQGGDTCAYYLRIGEEAVASLEIAIRCLDARSMRTVVAQRRAPRRVVG